MGSVFYNYIVSNSYFGAVRVHLTVYSEAMIDQ